MLYNLLLILHIIVVVALIGVILIQRGRSGGLVEALGGVESIFGTKTSAMLVRTTIILAVMFFVTSISLAYISKVKGKSLVDRFESTEQTAAPSEQNIPVADQAIPAVPAAPAAPADAQ